MKKLSISLLTTAIVLVAGTQLSMAKVSLPPIFSDNMILQQLADIPLEGTATPGAIVSIQADWNKKAIKVQADEQGKWSAHLRTPKAGKKSYSLRFDDGESIVFENVVVGEVWFCSGQSNMEMPGAGWGKVLNYENEIAQAEHPDIRLFQVKKATSLVPMETGESTMGGWKNCSPSTVPEFSALAYFYARELQQKLHIPIGVIDCTWGGTPAEAWTSYQSLKKVCGYESLMQAMEAVNYDKNKVFDIYGQLSAEWKKQASDIDEGFKHRWEMPEIDTKAWETMNLPNYWEQQGLQNFDGVVWFRKEVEIAETYAGKDLVLHCGIIDDEDLVYWNGELIARGSGYNVPRHYSLPGDKVRAGKNTLCIRVFDTGGEGGIAGKAADMFVQCEDENILSLSGEWKYGIGCSLSSLPQPPVWPESSSYPGALFNAMVHPWLDFPIKGVIWYQGCANVGRARQYEVLFQTLIHDWRQQFDKADMPFYFVQLANFQERVAVQAESPWAALREAQSKALCLENTGMVSNIDLGEAYDIHPKNKQAVAKRLAALALAKTYGKKVPASAPVYRSHQVKDGKIYVSFDIPPFGEAFAENADIKGFIIAGADGQFYPANAHTENGKVVVSSPQVPYPMAVRYGWADNPECNLYTPSGLIVAPFRSDQW